jgi:hypothetical protein
MKLHPLVLALGLLPLVGCSDSSDSTTDSGADKQLTYSVRAVDGYLRNAQVWLDITPNFQLDKGEPNTLSLEGGVAILDVSGFDNPAQYSVVVKAIASQTIDEDSLSEENPNGTPMQGSFIMSAPAGQTVVTPLSTLVNIKMTNGLEQAEAISEVAEELAIPEADLLGDYIADKKGDITAKANAIVELAVLPKTGAQMQEMNPDILDTLPEAHIEVVKGLTADKRLVKDENGVVSAEANHDNDGDGFIDAKDAFPDDGSEWLNTDDDEIGNNADLDDDNDGLSDLSETEKGTNPLLPDTDNDGVNDLLDALPLDDSETVDTDGNGIGNNEDLDDDNDGLSDISEAEKGTNPLLSDTDDDDVNDLLDAFPLDPTETVDTDGNGIGNNEDLDDDNDGLSDISEDDKGTNPLLPDTDSDGVNDLLDDLPLNENETVDTDGDGIGNNADLDDDGDEIADDVDEFPLGGSMNAAYYLQHNTRFSFFDFDDEELGYDDVAWNSGSNEITTIAYRYDANTQAFVIGDDERGDYTLTAEGWIFPVTGNETLTPQSDNTIIFDDESGIYTQVGAGNTRQQLADSSIYDFLNTMDAGFALSMINPNTTFSQGATAMAVTWTSSSSTPIYSLYLSSCEQPEGYTDLPLIEVADTALCNQSIATMLSGDEAPSNLATQTIAQITAGSAFVPTSDARAFVGMYWNEYAIRLVTDGSVDIYYLDWEGGINSKITGDVTWQEIEVEGKTLITFSTDEVDLSDFNHLFLTELGGYVRSGDVEVMTPEIDLIFNDTAMQDIVDAVLAGGPDVSSLIGYWGNEDITFQFNSDMTYIMDQLTSDDDAPDSWLGTESGHYQYNAVTGRITVSSLIYDNNGTSGLSDSLLEPDYRFGVQSSQLNQSLTFYYIDDDESGSFTLNAINNAQRICSQNDTGEVAGDADYDAYLTAATNCGATQSFDTVTMEGLTIYHHGPGSEYQGYLFNGNGTGTYVEDGGYSDSFSWSVNEGIMAINNGGDLEYLALIATYGNKYNVLSFYTWDDDNTPYSDIIGQEFTTDEPVISDTNLASLYNAGLNWFWAEQDGDERELEYGSIIRSEQGAVTEIFSGYNFETDLFISEQVTIENSAEDELLVLESDGTWKPENEAIVSITANPDGSLTIDRPNGVGFSNNVTAATAIDLTDVNIASQLANTEEDGAWGAFVLDSAVFTNGAIAYNVQFSSFDYYQLESLESWCGDGDLTKVALEGICNYIQSSQPNSLITSFDSLKAERLAVDWHHISGDIYNNITMKLNAGGTVSFWEENSPTETPLDPGTWQEITVNGETLIEVIAPQSVSSLGDHFNDDGTLYFAEYLGFVRKVWKEAEGGQELLFNDAARENILTALDVSLTESPLIGFWANENVSFQFNADMTYIMEQLTDDGVPDSWLGTESGVYHYDAVTGRITVSSLIYDNNGTSGLSDSLQDPEYRFVLQSYERNTSLTFFYIDGEESDVFTLTASTSGQPAVPEQFSADFLAGKTFYPVWFGIAEVDGSEVDNVTAVAEIAFNAQGTSANYQGILMDNDIGDGNFLITGDGRLYETEDGSTSGYEISDCGSATHFMQINYIEGGVFDNAELWFYDKDAALAYAAQLTQSIPLCALN